MAPVASLTDRASASDAYRLPNHIGGLAHGVFESSAGLQTPIAAQTFVDSIGINSHAPTLYGDPDFSTIVSLEQQLGVKHYREGILPSTPSYNAAINQILNATGAHLDGLAACANVSSSPTTSPAAISQFDAAIGNRMDALEGPNEVDISGDPNWVADTTACLPGLNTALPNITVYAPSLANPNGDATSLGNLSALVTDGNVHRYLAGRNPATQGWGGPDQCGSYGGLAWALCLGRITCGTEPIVITETGYNSQTEVDEATQAKYLSRTFLVNLQAGVVRTYVYDLKDYTGGDSFGGDGLVRVDDSIKPSYTMLQNLLATFADRSYTSVPSTPISYQLSNTNLDSMLFEKRDGTYILALWNEAVSWDVVNDVEIAIAPQQETIQFALPPTSFSSESFTDTGALAPTQGVTSVGTSVTLPVDDHVTLVSFHL